MTTFWILTAAMSLAVAALLIAALMRNPRNGAPAESTDLAVYRDQLREIDRDAERGVIGADEAGRLHTEVSRRLLAADAKARDRTGADGRPRKGGLAMAAFIAALVIGGGYGLYGQIGAPGYRDLPLAQRIAAADEALRNRPSQEQTETEALPTPPREAPESYLALVEKLRKSVQDSPEDVRGQVLLARSEAELGNFRAAYEAQQAVVALRGETARASDYADLAEMMILAAGGLVSPEAQEVLNDVLARDPRDGVARYYLGLMMVQTGRPDIAFEMWDGLLKESTPQAPWVPPILAQIDVIAYGAGQRDYKPPQALTNAPDAPRGPNQDDVDAAAGMSPQDRVEMIRSMVSTLSERLASQGGPPEEWARLINALAVLGETDDARAIVAEAAAIFAQDPEALSLIDGAAQRAGLGE